MIDKIEKKDLVCINCGENKQTKFYNSKDKFKKYFNKLPYCKDCVKKIYEDYLLKYKNNVNLAIYFMCRKIDVPYIHSNYEGAINNINNPDATVKGEDAIISAYFKGFGFAEKNGWGSSFDASQGENQIEGLSSYDVLTKVKKTKINNKDNKDNKEYDIIEYDTEVLKQKWGNYTNEDLSYLESEYIDWEDKLNGVIDKSTDIMIKEVCLQCNEIRKDRETATNVDKKIKTLQDLLKTSGLIDKQDTSFSDKSVGMIISDIEYKRPIKKSDIDFTDVDNFTDIIYGFTGAMLRTLGIENEYTEKFDEIYGKYSIDIIDDLVKKYSEELDVIKETGDIIGTE